jgi:hypothetical protein
VPLPLNDPVSMPLEPTVSLDDFEAAETCAACHDDHYAQWSSSMHAYAMVDPLFQRLVELRQEDLSGTEDKFCVQCHSAIGVRSGTVDQGFSFDDLPDIVMEGITCESCHKVSSVERASNSGHVLDSTGPLRGPGDVESPVHATETTDVLADSAFCGGCHDVLEVSGLPLERPYSEWLESPAAADGPTCQDCHMPPTESGHDHRFVGVDLPMVEGFIDEEERVELQGRIQDLLAESATLELDVRDVGDGAIGTAVVTVHNDIVGHAFPTGSTFIRQVWVEVVASADGVPFYETGTLDANGDLRDYWSAIDPYGDSDLLSLSSSFTDVNGHPTLFSWKAEDHTSRAISPGYARTWTLFLPVPDDAVDVTVEARLRFRPLPPHLLRLVGLTAEADAVPIYDVDTVSWSLSGP